MGTLVRLILLLLLGCGRQMDYLLSEQSPLTKLTQNLSITAIDSNGDSFDVVEDAGKVTLLIFGQDTCIVCGEETEHFLGSLNNPLLAPTRINMVTLLVGAIVEDADYWKFIFDVPWKVGIDTTGEIFRQYCPLNTVPCIVVHDPLKGIVLRHHGAIDLDYLKSLTGPWE